MKNYGKRILSALLSVLLLVGLMPLQAMAEEITTPDYLDVSDNYLKVTVSKKNGGFLIDTLEGDKLNKDDNNKFLLYPDANYDTSYTSFRVTRGTEVKDYIFGRSYAGSSEVTVTENTGSITAAWSVDGLTFTQTITLANTESAQNGMASISYGVTAAAGKAADKVQARVLLDTALGYQDYAVYELTKGNSSYQQVQKETVLDNKDGKAYEKTFFAYDDPKSPSITAYTVNATVSDKEVKPYQLAFGHWNNLAASVFDFTADDALTFTNANNEKYLTADSAYALYFDMGDVPAGGSEKTIATYYGVYSNSKVSAEDKAAINFTGDLEPMKLNDAKTAYLSKITGGTAGDFPLTAKVKNTSGSDIKQMAVAVYPQQGITPYKDNVLQTNATYTDPYTVSIVDMKAGEERDVPLKFNAQPLQGTDYRKIELRCFDVSDTDGKLLSGKQLASRTTYLLCPGATGAMLSFLSATPEVIYNQGTRHLYLAGQNFTLLQDSGQYSVVLKPMDGGRTITVPPENFILNTTENTADLVLDQFMPVGSYQLVFDWNDTSKADTTAEALRFTVSDDPTYQSGTYGLVTIEQADSNQYKLKAYRDEDEYKDKVPDAKKTVLLEFRGDFSLTYEEVKGKRELVEAKAVSLETADHKASSTINISNCLDVEKGSLTIAVEKFGTDDQVINTDIDGEVYTTGARTKVWSGVCAITSIENGDPAKLLQYTKDGTETSDIENSISNTSAITLIWPGAASTAQTLAGMVMELRYGQFGMMATEAGPVTDDTPRRRVIAFGAELSPDFLIPSNFKWNQKPKSTLERTQIEQAKERYSPQQLREVTNRYKTDQEKWETAAGGSLSLYVHDILFGGGFIGFNTSIELALPAYTDGLPSIEGALNLKVMDKEYAIGVKGSADMMVFQMEAELRLRSHNGIPIPDKLYFYAGGFTPGINVDGFGIFWVQGAGGGIDNLYETIYPVSAVPPVTLLLSGQYSLFSVLSARGDLSVSPRGFGIGLSDLKVGPVTLLDYAGLECAWYPEFRFAARIQLSILDIINGEGYIIVEKNKQKNNYFWEGFATVGIEVPAKIPIVGGVVVGSADLGVNAEKVWGAIHILKLDVGVTYFWGADVDFAFGKYDAPEPTIPYAMAAYPVPVYHDKENGRTLYMAMSSAAQLLAEPNGTATQGDSKASVTSDSAKKNHTFNLGTYGTENGVLTLSFAAENQGSANEMARQIAIPGYTLNWMDPSKNADAPENLNANAMMNWDKDTKKANVTISFTEKESFGKNWNMTTPAAADLKLYALKKLPTLDTLTFDSSNNKVTWSGGNLDDVNSLTVCAVDGGGKAYPVYRTEDNAAINAGSADITLPENLPSGTYTLKATVSSDAANPSVEAETKLDYINSNQPSAPVFTADLGGDYSIDLNVTSKDAYDGYLVDIYEINGDKKTATVFANMDIAKGEDGKLPTTLTVGGQFTQTVTTDADGKVVSLSDMEEMTETERAALITTETQQGLQAGKTYQVGLRGYKILGTDQESDNDTVLSSAETFSTDVQMVAPTKTTATLAANDATKLADVDTVKTKDVTVTLTADTAVSGTWTLDGEQTGELTTPNTTHSIALKDLEDGTHMLSFKGENATKDGVINQYLFTVDTLPPRLQLSSPSGGGFFDETLSITGITDPGAKVMVAVENAAPQPITVDETGAFTQTINMDTTVAYQNVVIYAEDALGNRSAPVTAQMVNRKLGAQDATLALYLNDTDYTDTILPANASGTLSLKVKTTDNTTITVNEDSAMAARINWQLKSISGTAALNGNRLTTGQADTGTVSATLDQQTAVAVLGGTQPVLTITCTAPDMVYTGAAYDKLGTPTAEGYTGAFTVVYADANGAVLQAPPTQVGSYTVTVTPTDSSYTGSWHSGFQILASAPSGGNGGSTTPTPDTGECVTADGITTVSIRVEPTQSTNTATAEIAFNEAKQALDAAQAEAKKHGTSIKLNVQIAAPNQATAVEVKLSAKTLGTIEQAKAALTVNTPLGTVQLEAKQVQALLEQSKGETVVFRFERVSSEGLNKKQLSALGNHTNHAILLKLTITAGSNTITDLGGEGILAIPYVLKPGEHAEDFAIWHLTEAGAIVPCKASYQAENQQYTAPTTHLSIYALVLFPMRDVPSQAWYYGDVAYAYRNGLMNGTSATAFEPEENTTRGMLTTILYRMDGSKPTDFALTFQDIQPDAYYAEGVRWAVANGIASGYNAEHFAPDDLITREQMVTMLYRYAKYKGYDVDQTNDLSAFKDADQVSSWAKAAMGWAVMNGIVGGTDNATILPNAYASRSEVAAILHRFLGQTEQ